MAMRARSKGSAPRALGSAAALSCGDPLGRRTAARRPHTAAPAEAQATLRHVLSGRPEHAVRER